MSAQAGLRVEPGRLLALLLVPDGQAALVSTYQELGAWPLLNNRIFALRQNVFSTPTTIRSALERHKTNVDWQIRRIYRARNQVMHQATRPRHLGQLIQHLHTYFAQTLTALVRGVRDFESELSVWEALEHRRRLYEYLTDCLNGQRKRDVTQEVLLEPERLLGDWGATPAWSAE